MKIFLNITIILFFVIALAPKMEAQDGFSKIIVERRPLPNGKVLNETTYLQDFSPNAQVKDLTEEIKLICKSSKSVTLNDKNVTVWYSALDPETVNLVIENLSKAVYETQIVLLPLSVDNVEIYLLPIDRIKFNFKISLESNLNTFHFLKPYAKLKELSLNCENGYALGSNIFLDIPHELTHNALRNIINQEIEKESDYPRWFEEGLAEFVSIKVASKLASCWADFRESFTLPEVSLNRKEIRKNLFSWRKDNAVIYKWFKSKEVSEKISWNELAFYGASYQLIKNDFEADDNKNKLKDLLTLLVRYPEKSASKIQNAELMKIYEGFTGSVFDSKGKLSNERETTIVKSEADFIIQDLKDNLPEKNKIKRYKSLSILASADELLSFETLRILLEIKKRIDSIENKNTLGLTYLGLINTAISVRLKNKEFEKILFKILKTDYKASSDDLKKMKENFIRSSYRPI